MARRRTVSTLEVRLSGNMSEALEGLNKVGTRAQKLGRDLRRTGYSLSRNLTAPIAAMGAAAATASVKAANFLDTIDKTAVRTGLARDRLQELRFAGDQLGVSFEAIEKGVEALTRRIPQFEEGTSEVGEAWQQLGLDLRDADGELRPMGELFPEVVDRLGEMQNATERNAVALQLFGRRGAELIPLLEASGDSMQALMARARELGIVVGEDQVADFVRYKDLLSETLDVLRTVGIQVVSVVLPLFESVATFFRDSVAPAIQRVTEIARELDPVWIEMAAAAGAVAAAAGPLAIAIGSLSGALAVVLSPAGAVVAGLAALAAGAVYVARNWDELRVLATKVWMGIQDVVFTAVGGILDRLEALAGWVPGLGEKIRGLRRDFEAFADDALAGSLESLNRQEDALEANAQRAKELADETDGARRATQGHAEAADGAAAAMDREREAADRLRGGLQQLSTEHRRIFEDLGRRTRGERIRPSEEFARMVEDRREGRTRWTDFTEEGERAAGDVGAAGEGMGQTFERSIARGIAQFESFGEIGSRILDNLKTKIIDTLVSGLFAAGGPLGGLFGGLFGGFFGGGRQHGGPVRPGRAFLVGERGPELFVPPRAGRIVPDVQRAAARGAAGTRPVVNVTVPPPDVSKLPPPKTPREAARDRAWLQLMRHTERELDLVRSER